MREPSAAWQQAGGTAAADPDPEAAAAGAAGGEGADDRSLQMRGAQLHVLGDTLQSIAVAVAGAVIWYRPQWYFIDPLCTFAFAALVLFSTGALVRDIVDVVMERTPRHIDLSDVEAGLLRVPGVVAVHDLHVWSLMPGKVLLSAHVVRVSRLRGRSGPGVFTCARLSSRHTLPRTHDAAR